MKAYKNLHIVGTSHIAIESVKAVENTITKIKPKIVAIELDKKRFYSLISKKKRKVTLKDIKKIGLKGFLFNLIGAWAEDRLGKTVGMKPGSEMKKAIQTAKKVKADLALVDQDIEITLKRLSAEITWKEKVRFFIEVIKIFLFKKPEIIFDLTKVPDKKIITKLTNKLKKNYPSFYKVLIKERNEHMAKALYKLMTLNQDKDIVAIMGAGHEEDIIKLIKNENKIHRKRS